ncbi:hypothetical protein DCAR_0102587 [Daucus carota subsp. sativus]|uniref:Uncharacterized protein n=1 Tax=Daucus carota subsp. sativus TaxID=79200 RepID=A0A169WSA5_DAUCS|nr:hypothetical protein DCAR_0102587 [Daucus carota subsp. sativus]
MAESIRMRLENFGRKPRSGKSTTTASSPSPPSQPLCKYQYQPNQTRVCQVAPTASHAIIETAVFMDFYNGRAEAPNKDYFLRKPISMA